MQLDTSHMMITGPIAVRGQVFAFGCNSSGQLGLGDFQDRRAPCEVSGLWALPVVALSAGDEHSTALTANGFLFAWGANDRGQLGLPKNADAAERVRLKKPNIVSSLHALAIAQILSNSYGYVWKRVCTYKQTVGPSAYGT